ncbi:MAG TPA: hypothetical protein VM434_04080 [Beijerinckiaceae bacterium]|nr:hypothetical protein [Beijerinckiaceae bacterium]
MRKIEIGEGLRIRFPERGSEFDEGVEIGMVAALIEADLREFRRTVASATVPVARALAAQLGYRVTEGGRDGDRCELVFRSARVRPQLRLVGTD